MPLEPPAPGDPRRRTALTRSIAPSALLLVAALAACSADAGPGATTPAPPAAAPASEPTVTVAPSSPPTVPAGGEPVGFTTVTARVTDADGEVCEVCLWLADTPGERARGLMDVTTLGPAAGMVFVFEQDTAGAFYMFDTPTPLSIAWFADDGPLVGTADMEPCLDRPAAECPLYAPGASYRYAVEVFAGGLGELGVGPGTRFELVAGTEADTCPVGA